MAPLPPRWSTKLVGVTFTGPGYADRLGWLQAEHIRSTAEGHSIAALLIRNPANPHDGNAVEVHIAGVGMVGHIGGGMARRLAPLLDNGERWRAVLDEVIVDPDHPTNPGIAVTIFQAKERAGAR
jgi:hypothetical protein